MKALFGMALASLLLFTACRNARTELIVTNSSGVTVTELQVDVYGEKFAWKNVLPGEHVYLSTASRSDSEYRIKATFADGTTLNQTLGYLTHGMDFRDVIALHADSAMLNPKLPGNSANVSPNADKPVR